MKSGSWDTENLFLRMVGLFPMNALSEAEPSEEEDGE